MMRRHIAGKYLRHDYIRHFRSIQIPTIASAQKIEFDWLMIIDNNHAVDAHRTRTCGRIIARGYRLCSLHLLFENS